MTNINTFKNYVCNLIINYLLVKLYNFFEIIMIRISKLILVYFINCKIKIYFYLF